MRFQLGQADKFRAGLIRSGAWMDHIPTMMRECLPPEIAICRTSSRRSTPTATRVGAAGLWQFMRATGRRFMRIDHVVDERFDPYSRRVRRRC